MAAKGRPALVIGVPAGTRIARSPRWFLTTSVRGSGGVAVRLSESRQVTGAMVTLHFMFYNVGRVHQTLRVTPAMEAGIVSADHVWSIDEIVGLLG